MIAIVVEGNIHPAADVLPPCDIGQGSAKPCRELVVTCFGYPSQHPPTPGRSPTTAIHVRIALLLRQVLLHRIAVVEFIRTMTHESRIVPVRCSRLPCWTRTGQLIEHQLGAVELQKLDIVRDLENTAKHCTQSHFRRDAEDKNYPAPSAANADSDLACRSLPVPVASALPGEHRPLVPGGFGGSARLHPAVGNGTSEWRG